MEDILASIRKMISDDPAPEGAGQAAPTTAVLSEPPEAARAVYDGDKGVLDDPSLAPDNDDDLADLLAADDGATHSDPAPVALPTTGFMAPAIPGPAPTVMLNPVGEPVQTKTTWGLRRASFIPGYERANPTLDGAPNMAPATPSMPQPGAPASHPSLADTGDFGSIVPGAFGRRDSAPAAPKPLAVFPKPPLRLQLQPGFEAQSDAVKAPPGDKQIVPLMETESPISLTPADDAAQTAASVHMRQLNGDADLAALVGQAFERHEPQATQMPLPEVAPLAEKPVHVASFARQEPVLQGYSGATALPPAALVNGMVPSAKTLEDVVGDLLRPMLKTWLDANMPRMLEAALRKEAGFGGSGGDRDKS